MYAPRLICDVTKISVFQCFKYYRSLEPTIIIILDSFSRAIIIIILKFFENAGFLIWLYCSKFTQPFYLFFFIFLLFVSVFFPVALLVIICFF